MPKKINLEGHVFGALKVLREHPITDSASHPLWEVECGFCKSITLKTYSRLKGIKSCGCKQGKKLNG